MMCDRPDCSLILTRGCVVCLKWDRDPQSDRRGEERAEVHKCPGIWHLELQLLTSGSSIDLLESSYRKSDFVKVAHDCLHL